mmetsp:Transcript_47929/g.113921  ORF Transcript_47929/g.113921 Transcript_47929/m.113921 type:complete len:466 (+) Transcript_47929:116-1513(+)
MATGTETEDWIFTAAVLSVLILTFTNIALLRAWLGARGRNRRLELQSEEEGALLRACFDVWVTVDMDLTALAADLDPRLVRMLNGDPNGMLSLLEHTHRDDRERLRSIVDSLTVGSPVAQKIRVKFVANRNSKDEAGGDSPVSSVREGRSSKDSVPPLGNYEVELAIVHYRPFALVVGITLRDFEPFSAKINEDGDSITEFSIPVHSRRREDLSGTESRGDNWRQHRSVSEVSSVYSSEDRYLPQVQSRIMASEEVEPSCAQSFSSMKVTDASEMVAPAPGHLTQVTQSYAAQKHQAFQARLNSLVEGSKKSSRRHLGDHREPPRTTPSRTFTNLSEGSDAASIHGRVRPSATQLEIAVGMKRHSCGYLSPRSGGLAVASQSSEAGAVGSVRYTLGDNISEAGWKSMATSEIKSMSNPVSEEEEEEAAEQEDTATESVGTARLPAVPNIERVFSAGPSHASALSL